ncbi:unnamed protein product [Chrysoparadoxa australica]
MDEAEWLGAYILGNHSEAAFYEYFAGKTSENFDPTVDLERIGVVNQTTMLATETQAITNHLRNVMKEKFGAVDLKNHIADTRDTLCYATNDNQSATYGLLEQEADVAIVVGGFNSSNTTHLVELLEPKFKTIFLRNESDIKSINDVVNFNIHTKTIDSETLPAKSNKKQTFIITSGASCPDATVDRVMQKLLELYESEVSVEQALAKL